MSAFFIIAYNPSVIIIKLPATKHNSPTRGSERKISEILDLEVIPAIGDP
jgi:hypothetical protein